LLISLSVSTAPTTTVNQDSDGVQLRAIFDSSSAAFAAVVPGPAAPAQRRAVDNELRKELYSFLGSHTNSAYGPGVRLYLARGALMRSCYAEAMELYARVWADVRGLEDHTAQNFAREATGALARLLAMTGRFEDLDALERDTRQLVNGGPIGNDWASALETRDGARSHPNSFQNCGLVCLNELARVTQAGRYNAQALPRVGFSTSGVSAADLVRIGTAAGMRLRAAMLSERTHLPVPSIVHLRSEHFVVVREQRGAFYGIDDPAIGAPRWLLAGELADEATGCVIVNDAAPVQYGGALSTLAQTDASAYRGLIPSNGDHDDNPCPPDGDDDSGCCGAPVYFVSDYLNLWTKDVPLKYKPAYGPAVVLGINYTDRRAQSVISLAYWHGAQLGNRAAGSVDGLWGCTWLSFAELDVSDGIAEVMLPASGWTTFTFPPSSTNSDTNYKHNGLASQLVLGGNPVGLKLQLPDGSSLTYGLKDTRQSSYDLLYLTAVSDPSGKSVTFTYDLNYYLTGVTAADGTTFTVNHGDSQNPDVITSITSSYGASVTFTHDSVDGSVLVGMTDAAGISSQLTYKDPHAGGPVTQIIGPYGTASFLATNVNGIFDRTVEATNNLGLKEFYARLDSYTGGDWPDFNTTTQLPSNTPLGTLDTASGTRQTRNTFYWNPRQFASLLGTSFSSFNWAAFEKARIRHWLLDSFGNVKFDTLSHEQLPSPDGGTTEGQLTFYDYKGKPSGNNDYPGTQILPSVVARVMPDGTTSYQYFERLTNGWPTLAADKWVTAGTDNFRTNTYLYSTNNIDLLAWTNALGIQVASNVFNARHQITTNYDALGQGTTNTYDDTSYELTSVSRPTGLQTIYTYDQNGRLTNVADVQINRTNSYTWYANGNMQTHTDERRLTVTSYWDGLNRLTGTSDPRGTTTNLYSRAAGPYANGNGSANILDVTATMDRLTNWTYFDYDALRRRTAITNANNVVTRFGYCDCGSQVTSQTNAFGSAIQETNQYVYDSQSRRTQVTQPDGTVVNYTYDGLGRRLTTSDGWGSVTNAYDNLNRRFAVSNALGRVEFVIFDLLDRATNSTDLNGVTITNAFDELNRLRIRGYADGGTEKFGYSARGLIAYTNELGLTNYYAYDEGGRKTFETNANHELIQFQYDASGSLTNLIDGKNQSTKWGIDQYNRCTNKTDQAGVEILRYTYDSENHLLSRWSKEKGTTYYTNDAVGNLLAISYPQSGTNTYAYDGLNRLTNMVDGIGTTKYTYALGGLLHTEDGPFASDTVTNIYWSGVRTNLSLQQPSGAWTNRFGWDAAKRLTNVTSQAGSFTNEYFPGVGGASGYASRLVKRLLLPSLSVITNNYDSVGRQLGTWLRTSTGVALDTNTYGYNSAGQRTTLTNAAATYQYTYDNIGQLTISASSVSTESLGYFYDAAWNMNRRTNNGVVGTFTVDNKNELTNAPPGFNTITYDSNGNMLSHGGPSGKKYFYAYDDENRLEQWYSADHFGNGLEATQFIYDGLGRLRQRLEYSNFGGTSPSPIEPDSPTLPTGNWVLDSETDYIYDGKRVIQERDVNNTPTVSYTRGADLSGTLEGAGGIGGLLARSDGYSAGNWTSHTFYHADGIGNITYLVDGSQALAASYRYDPFGNTITSSGPLADANVYRFSSKEIHVNTGIYYYLYRFYHPNLQRWINRDPLAAWSEVRFRRAGGDTYKLSPWETFVTPNLYEYVYNSPLSYIDPNGLWGVGVIGTASGDLGVGFVGAGATGSVGGGYFWGGQSGGNAGVFASGGAFVRESPGVVSLKAPDYDQTPWSGGAYAGVGAGAFLTNAKRASDLSGPFKQWNLNTPWFSLSFGWSGGTWICSATVGPGAVGSASGFPTGTVTYP
jgi:RHS repeat-associated protein